MVFRKRRSPAPAFRQSAPFNPLTGQYAPIGRVMVPTRLALMQVIEADTHENYVVCRGFDPEDGLFYNSVSVAKPYGVRGLYPYRVAQVFPACRVRTKLGDNSGVAETSTGYPADLNEDCEILLDDDGVAIDRLLLSDGTAVARWIEFDVAADFEPTDTSFTVENVEYFGGTEPAEEVTTVQNGVERAGTEGTRAGAVLDSLTGKYRLAWIDREDPTEDYPPGTLPETEECQGVIVTAQVQVTETTTTSTAAEGIQDDPVSGEIEMLPVPDTLPWITWCLETGEPYPWDPDQVIVNPGLSWSPGDMLHFRTLPDGSLYLDRVDPSPNATVCTACLWGLAPALGFTVTLTDFVDGGAIFNGSRTVSFVEDERYVCRYQVDVDPEDYFGCAHIVHAIWWNWEQEKFERTVFFYADGTGAKTGQYVPLCEWYTYYPVNRPNCRPHVAGTQVAVEMETFIYDAELAEAVAFVTAVDCSGTTCTVTAIMEEP